MLRPCLSLLFPLLAGAVLSLSSCRITGRQVDTTWLTDALTPPENDAVQVETGRGRAVPPPPQTPSPSPTASTHAGRGSAQGFSHTQANSYVVRPGDTLFAIARRQGVSPSALMAENHLTVNSKLHPGQVLRLPLRKAASSASRNRGAASTAYIVRQGDTISGIAARHHISKQALLKANGMTPEQASRIRVGQKLRLPSPQR